MVVEIKNNVEGMNFENLARGDLFVYHNETFMVLTDDVFYSGPYTRCNAVNLETGMPKFFSADTKVIHPSDYTLTVEL